MVASESRRGDPSGIASVAGVAMSRPDGVGIEALMSRTPVRFPIAFRSAALILVLVVVSLATGPMGAGAAPSQQQVQDAKARVAQLLGELKDMRAKLDAIDQDLAAATAEVDRQR